MKMQIKEFAKFTNVSVRTLHYYDEIGLLLPAYVDEYTGYRYYDEESLLRMQEILFYRELDFSLKSIKAILSSPNYDKKRALQEQKQLLTLKKERLERLIAAIDSAQRGECVMEVFQDDEYEQYKEEVKRRWGETCAYKEYGEKNKTSTKQDMAQRNAQLMELMAQFGKMKDLSAESEDVQSKVGELQAFISDNFYYCTKEILAGLGQMYVADERFRNNIDKSGGEGTAEFIAKAIAYFCKA